MATNWERADGINPRFWRKIVIPTIKRLRNNQCEECTSDRFLEVHHTDYKNVNLNTLKLLCKKYHRTLHSNLKKQGIILTDIINKK